MESLLIFCIVIMSVVLHELSHGYMAYFLGDPTAYYAGRLTINPLKHIDPFGTILLPLGLTLIGAPAFGYARPVPYNPYNLKDGRWGPFWVALAGPASNIALAAAISVFLRFFLLPGAQSLLISAVVINVSLAVFNMIPVAPMDGYKVFASLVPYRYGDFMSRADSINPIALMFVLFFGVRLIAPIIYFIAGLLLG